MSSIVFIGVIIHIILLYSIFDIYYTSPVVKNASAYRISDTTAPANRIVVFSADGLRWDTFHDNPELSPFLHSIIENRKGIFGISRSHVPTESRPGHVAMFAGFSEDVSAVAKGWKKNPVPFDSVFNRSDEAFIWGSPDITTLFDDHPHVKSTSYNENDEDFNSDEAYKLDQWVFEHVEKFLEEEKVKPERMEKLQQPRKVFFLHLLGLDTNGHGKKPHSSQYKENLKFVDIGIAKISQLFEDIFQDEKTAFIFTSDHGMTDWGSHGGGSDDEILTPLVAWGAGIHKGGAMKVVAQVDLAPLMSALLGVAIPVNSVGVLPLDAFSTSPIYTFKAFKANFLQLNEQIAILRQEKSQRIFFREFEQFGEKALKSLENEMQKLAKLGRHSMAASLFVENADLMRQAIFYYHRYDRWLLGMAVSITFVSWIALVWVSLQGDSPSHLTRESLRPNNFFRLIMGGIFLFCWYCSVPWTNFVYLLLPIGILSTVENLGRIGEKTTNLGRSIAAEYKTMSFSFLIGPFVGFIGLSVFLFICVIVFMDRRFLSAVFLLFFIVPSLYPQVQAVQEWKLTWRILCCCLLPFPFFSNVGRYEIPILCVLSPLLAGVSLKRTSSLSTKYTDLLSLGCYAAAGIVLSTSYLFPQVPSAIRLLCWISLPLSIVLPLTTDTTVYERLIVFIVALYVPYSLLSIAYESLFMLLFVPILLIFLRFEFSHLSDAEFLRLAPEATPSVSQSKISLNEYRRAVMCVAFVLSILFGTGNFASLNAFNPSTLSRFISVFSPFTMAALLVAKLLIPLLIVTFVLATVLRFEKSAMQKLAYMVLMLTDLMAMCFFHQLKDEGSWADIGLSISHYIISMCMSVAILLLLLLSSSLMTRKLSLPYRKCDQDCSL